MRGCSHPSGRRGRPLRLPEASPPQVNYSILTGTLACDPWRGRSPVGDPVTFLRIEFPVTEPARPAELRCWARCDVEVTRDLAERAEVKGLQGGGAVLVAGQLSERWMIEAGRSGRRNVIVAALVQPGASAEAITGLGLPES
jgi:hypothetical protein